MRASLPWLASLSLVIACGGSEDGPCDPVAQSGCEGNQACEQVAGAEPACFAPVEVRGHVIDLADAHGIAGARVVAIDVNGGAASSVAVTASDGSYTLPVPAQRNADGTPAAFPVSLRADGAGYQGFPGAVRQALPVDVATATASGDGFVVMSTLTEIGLIAEPGASAGAIHGKAAVPDDQVGVVVVAEAAGKGYAAIAARDGDYKIFNLAAGHYTVTGYALGHVYNVGEIDVAASDVALDLTLAATAPGSIAGQVSIVNGGGASTTSVVAFVESTFDPLTGRGVAPPGLRAPRTGAPDVSGAFVIEGVPPGRYVVVAGFENDGLVRDPDHCIGGTGDVLVEVMAGQPTQTPTTFKVTGALPMIGPGTTAAEAIATAPTFQWADDSSEDLYVVEVFDSFGQRVWMASTPGVSGAAPSLAYTGAALSPGMYYRWRVTSSKKANMMQCELSRSEDLRGVFYTP